MGQGASSELCSAAGEGDADKVKDLVDQMRAKDVDITSVRDENGVPVISIAASSGSLEVLKCLLAAGCSATTPSVTGWTPVHAAAECGQVNCLTALLDAMPVDSGVPKDIDAPDDQGIVPLYAASFANQPDAVQYLLSRGANPNLQRGDGSTALHVACKKGNIDCLKALLGGGASALLVMTGNSTPLYIACAYSQSSAVNFLLPACPTAIEVAAEDGQTPLFRACAERCVDVVSALLAAGANPNLADRSGCTPLHASCGRSHGAIQCVQLLLEHGADAGALYNNETPLELSDRKELVECRSKLQELGNQPARVNVISGTRRQ